MGEIELEILKYNYWEHFKRAKELSFVLPLNHPERASIEREMKVMIEQINLTTKKK